MERRKMGVLIDNQQSKYKISLKKIRQKAQTILNALGKPDGELSILIVDNSRIGELNEKYLNRAGPTNVIAFPMQEGRFSSISPHLLGDVVISVEIAAKEGKSFGISLEERFIQLLVHGILHLLGYDHEKTDQEAEKMEQKSEELLELINYRGVMET
jgi:probable rRNA maturation factor